MTVTADDFVHGTGEFSRLTAQLELLEAERTRLERELTRTRADALESTRFDSLRKVNESQDPGDQNNDEMNNAEQGDMSSSNAHKELGEQAGNLVEELAACRRELQEYKKLTRELTQQVHDHDIEISAARAMMSEMQGPTAVGQAELGFTALRTGEEEAHASTQRGEEPAVGDSDSGHIASTEEGQAREEFAHQVQQQEKLISQLREEVNASKVQLEECKEEAEKVKEVLEQELAEANRCKQELEEAASEGRHPEFDRLTAKVAKLDDKVEKIQSEKMLLRDHIAEAKRLYREQQKETHKHKEQVVVLELQTADLNDLCNAKTRRVEALKQQGLQSEKNRVDVLKAAKQSIRAAALKFQSQAVLAEQAIADNQLLKEELLSAHKVMEGFKEKARRLTHMKRELADLRAEVGSLAKTVMETEERAATEVAKCRQEVSAMRAASPSASPVKSRRNSQKQSGARTPGLQEVPEQTGDTAFPAVRGAQPSAYP